MFRLLPPQRFDLSLGENGTYRLTVEGVTCKFSGPSSGQGLAKLYTLSANGVLLYVGIAKRRMSARLRHGFTAKGKGGYHGYKWKHLRGGLRLIVWTANFGGESAGLEDLKIIEAEVAFLCRQESDQWPRYQHEIHFFPSERFHRMSARKIYREALAD